MATYTFKVVTGANNKYKKDAGPYHRLRQVFDNIDPTIGASGNVDSLIITTARGNDVIAAGDTVIILAADGSTTSSTVLSSGNLDTTYDALNGLFPKAGGAASLTSTANDLTFTDATKGIVGMSPSGKKARLTLVDNPDGSVSFQQSEPF